MDLYQVVNRRILYTESIKKRSADSMSISKIRTFDSLHIAAAEEADADILLTVDDKFEKMAANLRLKTRVINPLRFAEEVI